MPPLTRRAVAAGTASILGAQFSATRPAASQQPDRLRGGVANGKVELPDTRAADPAQRRPAVP